MYLENEQDKMDFSSKSLIANDSGKTGVQFPNKVSLISKKRQDGNHIVQIGRTEKNVPKGVFVQAKDFVLENSDMTLGKVPDLIEKISNQQEADIVRLDKIHNNFKENEHQIKMIDNISKDMQNCIANSEKDIEKNEVAIYNVEQRMTRAEDEQFNFIKLQLGYELRLKTLESSFKTESINNAERIAELERDLRETKISLQVKHERFSGEISTQMTNIESDVNEHRKETCSETVSMSSELENLKCSLNSLERKVSDNEIICAAVTENINENLEEMSSANIDERSLHILQAKIDENKGTIARTRSDITDLLDVLEENERGLSQLTKIVEGNFQNDSENLETQMKVMSEELTNLTEAIAEKIVNIWDKTSKIEQKTIEIENIQNEEYRETWKIKDQTDALTEEVKLLKSELQRNEKDDNEIVDMVSQITKNQKLMSTVMEDFDNKLQEKTTEIKQNLESQIDLVFAEVSDLEEKLEEQLENTKEIVLDEVDGKIEEKTEEFVQELDVIRDECQTKVNENHQDILSLKNEIKTCIEFENVRKGRLNNIEDKADEGIRLNKALLEEFNMSCGRYDEELVDCQEQIGILAKKSDKFESKSKEYLQEVCNNYNMINHAMEALEFVKKDMKPLTKFIETDYRMMFDAMEIVHFDIKPLTKSIKTDILEIKKEISELQQFNKKVVLDWD